MNSPLLNKSLDFATQIVLFYDEFSKTKIEYRDVAQFGSALRSGRRGRRFESCHLDQK